MLKSISKLSRIRCATDLLPFTNYSKRTTSILPTLQSQPTNNKYAPIKYYSSFPEKRLTEISNVENKISLLRIPSDLMVLHSESSKESAEKLSIEHSTTITTISPTTKRKLSKDIVVAVDLSEYRNGNLVDPRYSIRALVKNFFLEMNVATATTKEIYQYFEEFGFYATQSEENKKKLKQTIVKSLNNNNCYRNVKFGTWAYTKSSLYDSLDNSNVKSCEDREYSSQIYMPDKDFIRNGNNFELYGYEFYCLKNAYAQCVQCNLLSISVKKWNEKLHKNIKIPKIGLLKMHKDGSVEGCPWKPSNCEHFCHQNHELRSAKKKDTMKITFQQRSERIPKLYKELEEYYASSFSAQYDLDNTECNLKLFLDKLEKSFPYSSSQKIAFIYFLRDVKNPAIKYYGVTSDYFTRFNDHLRKKCEREMIIAPLGRKNALFVKELEALLIRMSKKNLLNDGNSIENIRLGDTASKCLAHIYKNGNNNFSHDFVEAMNELINLTLRHGQVITEAEAETSRIRFVSKQIRDTRLLSKKSLQQLMSLYNPTDELTDQNSFLSITPLNNAVMPAELDSFLCEIEAIHKYTSDQIPAFLYFLKYPVDSSVRRYGVSKNPQERFQGHKWGKTLHGDFEMVVAPIGKRSVLFIEDLEALFIRFSKMKLLKDGKSNENEFRDDGNFNSKYDIFQAIVDQENHPRRPFVIKALNQLIELTLHSNINVESLKK